MHVTDQVFKRLLSTALKGIDEMNILALLDTSEKLKYARTYAQLINDLFYLKMKDDYLTYYLSLVTSPEFISSSHYMSKSSRKEHNLHRLKFIKQENIFKQQTFIQKRLQQVVKQLNIHKQQVPEHISMDLNRLSTVIPAFVGKGQLKLSADFERKKLLLKYDIDDYYLIYTFYNLNPTTDQIVPTKIIWQTTMDQQKNEEYLAILKQRIYTKRLPSSLNLIDHSIDPHTQQMLRDRRLHTDERITLSLQREKAIARFKQDMLTIEISTIEKLIRSHGNAIADEKKKLTDAANGGKVRLPKMLVDILNAITARQSNIIKRTQLITKHKLSFFECAPAIMDEEEIVGANL